MPDLTNHWLHDTVSALAYSFAQVLSSSKDPNSIPPYNDLTRFVLQQQAQLPDYLRGPMKLATLAFDLFGWVRTGHLFHSGRVPLRSSQISAWKNSGSSFQQDLMRYYESLTTFALHSRQQLRSTVSNSASSSGRTTRSEQAPLNLERELTCEFAVIGSGPGGAITACLLAEAGRDVLLIEEGPFQPLESYLPFSVDEMLQKYRNGGQTVAFGKNKIAYVEGRCVGGGSEINSGLYHRTPSEILDKWRKEFDVQALTDNELLPYFEANENDLSVTVGPVSAAGASIKLRDGAARLGWKSLDVPRWFAYDGTGQGAGERQSMTRTFIPRFLKANGRLLPSTRIERLRYEGSNWSLLANHPGGGTRRIKAETIFVCAGAIQTPALLRRSGMTQNIGRSLQLHPTVKVVAKFNDIVNTPDMGVPVHQVKEFAPGLSFGCSISTPAHLALGLMDQEQQALEAKENWSRMASYYAMITPEGRGTVSVLRGFSDPIVRYRLTTSDRRALAEGLRKLSELLFEAGAVTICPTIRKLEPLLGRDDMKRLPELLPNALANLMTIHLFSSCPMGEDKAKCAADSFGRVHTCKNLFVGDASLLCTAPGVNPQGTIMAIARRNATHFLGR